MGRVYYEWDIISECFRHFRHFPLPTICNYHHTVQVARVQVEYAHQWRWSLYYGNENERQARELHMVRNEEGRACPH